MEAVVRIADAKKAREITALEVTERTTLADYFLMMTGTSTTHIRALGDEIEFQLKQRGVMQIVKAIVIPGKIVNFVVKP